MSVPCSPTCARPAVANQAHSRRLLGLAVAVPALAVLGAALWLTPRPSGRGTHQKLGMPACSLLANSGWPCPTCGMTTSLSEAVRGRLGRAFRAHPFGPVLAGAMALLALSGLAQAASGRALLAWVGCLGWWWGVILGGGLLAGWGWKLLAGCLSGEYPLR